jgi:acetolactate synthase-1/2/3 large subunit
MSATSLQEAAPGSRRDSPASPVSAAEGVAPATTGAERLVHALVDHGVDVCFANPGTSEMHFVAALDRIPGMRCVLGLAEGVVTGAADGYYRIADRPAATLLHLGPGLANGLANLHNAKKARSGVVNIVGDHATAHLVLDAPLTSDSAAIATPMSHWVRAARSVASIADDGTEAIRQASMRPGRVATLILPADIAWSEVDPSTAPRASQTIDRLRAKPLAGNAVARAAAAVRHGATTLLLLGDRALRDEGSLVAGRIAAATRCGLKSDFFCARIQRGAGRAIVPRLPYAVDPLLAALAPFDRIVLVGAKAPVAFFAYPGKPGVASKPGCEIIELASPEHDPLEALRALADAVGADASTKVSVAVRSSEAAVTSGGTLDSPGIARVLTALIPENAIVVDESLTTGRAFDGATVGAAPHDWLTGTGGSIGFGLPVAVGAAIAAPERKVLALEGDGSAMYTPQALWTMAREKLDVTILVFANRTYKILLAEFANVGAGAPGRRASDMLSIDRPTLDWVALANGMGVEASRASDLAALADQLTSALDGRGPRLIEVVL